MPSSWQTRIVRSAISPRLATRTLLNTECSCRRLCGYDGCQRSGRFDEEERLVIFDRLAVFDADLDDAPCHVGFDLVHQLHRLDYAEHGLGLDDLADFDIGIGIGGRGTVKGAHN